MLFITSVLVVYVFRVSSAENGCVQETNCTLTPESIGLLTMSCPGFKQDDCKCDQQRNVNFVLECTCCSNQSRKRRGVNLEAMFGLKSYSLSNSTVPPVTTTTEEDYLLKYHFPIFQRKRLIDNSCGNLDYADPDEMVSEISVSLIELENVTLRSTHASTVKNCWNLCRYNILSFNKSCTAIGFIGTNAQKPVDDCFILSESPSNSTGKDKSVEIYEICV